MCVGGGGLLGKGVLGASDMWWFTSKAYKLVPVCCVDFAILSVIVYLTASLEAVKHVRWKFVGKLWGGGGGKKH